MKDAAQFIRDNGRLFLEVGFPGEVDVDAAEGWDPPPEYRSAPAPVGALGSMGIVVLRVRKAFEPVFPDLTDLDFRGEVVWNADDSGFTKKHWGGAL